MNTRLGFLAAGAALLALGVVGAGRPSVSRAAPGFSCGPNATTYSVQATDGRAGLGVRCVMPDSQDPTRIYWYGEGRWGDFAYRHLGFQTFSFGIANGTAVTSDIAGGDDNVVVTLQVAALNPNGGLPDKIDVKEWHERWTQVTSLDYTPLPANPGVCGPHFARYDVQPPDRAGSGVRCLMNVTDQSGETVWYGTGDWGGTPYAHMGLLRQGRTVGEAVDLCFLANGFCASTGPNALTFTYDPGIPGVACPAYHVTGAWHEDWFYASGNCGAG